MNGSFIVSFLDKVARDQTLPQIEVFPGVTEVRARRAKALQHVARISFDRDREAEVAEFIGTMPQVVTVDDGEKQVFLFSPQDVNFTLNQGIRNTDIGATQLLHYYNKFGRFPNMPYPNQLPKSVTYTEESSRLGSNIFAAILDQGIDTTHTDEFGSPTRVTRVSTTVAGTYGNHGTGCAGLFAGATCGFAKEARILDGKCFGDSSLVTGLSSITDCMDDLTAWVETPGNVAADEHVIISCSFGALETLGGNGYEVAVDAMEAAGIAVFAASGNNDINYISNDWWPAKGLRWGGVGACDLRRTRLHFSNFGPEIKLYGLGWASPTARLGNGNYIDFSGTSAACPVAAGCYATWATSQEAPRSQSEVWALQEEYVTEFCKQNTVRRDDFDTDVSVVT